MSQNAEVSSKLYIVPLLVQLFQRLALFEDSLAMVCVVDKVCGAFTEIEANCRVQQLVQIIATVRESKEILRRT